MTGQCAQRGPRGGRCRNRTHYFLDFCKRKGDYAIVKGD